MPLMSVSDTFRVDQTEIDSGWNDGQVAIEALTDGGFAVAWRQYEENGAGGFRIFARKYDAAGNAVGDMVKIDGVHRDYFGGQGFQKPSIAALAGGGFAVEYLDIDGGSKYTNGQDATFVEWTATFNSSGALVSQAEILGRPVQYDPYNTDWDGAITGNGDGGFHSVVIEAYYNDAGSGRRVVVNGGEVYRGTDVSTGTAGISDFGSGAFVVWQTFGGDIMGQTIGAGFDSTPFMVNTNTAGSQTQQNGSRANDSLAQLSNGSMVVVWEDTSASDDATDPGYGVHARIYGANGQPITGEIILPADPSTDERTPSVAALSGGRFVVVWQHAFLGPIAQVFSSTGERLGDQVTLGIPSSVVTLTVLSDDRIVFAWTVDGGITNAQVWRFPDKFGTAGNDNMTGTADADALHGLGGNDFLDGRGGADDLRGGAGNDTYIVDNSADKTVELADGGTDSVRSSVSYTLMAEVENLLLTGTASISGTGNGGNNSITGNGADNMLTGAGGDDTLNGGLGADGMTGGTGNDTYYVNESGDTVTELADEGTDRVYSGITLTLADNVEELVLTGGAGINGTGNGLANRLVGNGVANTLDGGDNADTMEGKGGNDIYIVNDIGDKIIETSAGGFDTVRSSITFNLSGINVEYLELTGDLAIDGTGNSFNNRLTGNDAANALDGRDGADTMEGRGGDDTYYVGAGDTVIEAADGGTDTVKSAITYSLAGQHIEKLELTGTAAIGATGNGLANTLIGNGGANRLNGGTNADTMEGKGGNDTYVIDNAGDVVIEGSGGGIDTVESFYTHTLGTHFENLTLLGGSAAGGTGNAKSNVMIGNTAGNALSAGGEADHIYGRGGNDTLTGGTGMDTFYIDTALNAASNVDKITDFSVADDTIRLSRTVFTGITSDGALAGSAFVTGTSAGDGDDRILYDSATGKIFYDADGNGAGAAVLFAQVAAGTALTNLDFVAYLPA